MKFLVLGRQYIAKSEEIIEGLQDLGHAVDYLLFPSLQYSQSYYSTHQGNIQQPIYKSKISYYLGHYNTVRKLLLNSNRFSNDYDYILAIDWLEASILLSLRKHYPQVKIIYYAYDYYFYRSLLSSRYLINRIERLAYIRSDIVWTVNSNIIEEHKKQNVNKKKAFTVPLGINSKNIPTYTPDPKQFLFMGNFKEGHNLRLLAKTFAQLPTGYHLHLIGQGNLYNEIKQLILDQSINNITMYGFKTEEETIDLIMKYKISYGLAIYENTQEIVCADPGKIKDYLSLGLPVITTNNHSMSRDIQDYGLGLVFEDVSIELDKKISNLDEHNIQSIKSNIQDYIQNHNYKTILGNALNKS